MNDEPSPDEVDRLLARLTPAEIRCLELVPKGLTSKEIARETRLSPNTVDAYLKSAAKKLNVAKRGVAAQMLVSAKNREVPKMVYGNSDISNDCNLADNEVSAGQGDGPDDLRHREPISSESRDSWDGPAWLEPYHPIAKFFGGENRLSLVQRMLWVIALAIGIGIGFGGLVSGLLQLSRLYSSP
ncbi:helix-turn-helix domain-containing protein [Sphingopyxis sp.]|uniref:helix-turn-helix domain-containing protein n=1 Tax=Sphingopyxis sp. TaxID=1908224 RepID=UPI003D6C9B29